MSRNIRVSITISLIFAAASLFFIGSAAAAYEVKVNLNTLGGGTGRVIFSATSSRDFEFSGWSGEACIGKDQCILRNLISKSSKTVIAVFNAPLCTEFTYSEWGGCQLDGTRRRAVTSAGPSGCVGGNPITSQGCFYDPCLRAQTLTDTVSDTWINLVKKFSDIWDSAKEGDFTGVVDKTIELVIGTDKTGYLPSVPPEAIGGGAPVEGGKFDVIGKGGQKVGAGGGVVTIPAPAPKPVPVGGEIDLGITLPPITITAPRYKPEPVLEPLIATVPRYKPEFNFDFNIGRDPARYCK